MRAAATRQGMQLILSEVDGWARQRSLRPHPRALHPNKINPLQNTPANLPYTPRPGCILRACRHPSAPENRRSGPFRPFANGFPNQIKTLHVPQPPNRENK